MSKIGKSVLNKKPSIKIKNSSNEARTRALVPVYCNRIIKILDNAEYPLYTAQIQRKARIGQWGTTSRILSLLTAEDKIELIATKRGSLYRKKK
jgi:hypothetical protein